MLIGTCRHGMHKNWMLWLIIKAYMVLFKSNFRPVTRDFLDHVYFVHPSCDISVIILTDTQPMYQSTYWPTLDRRISQHMDRLSADITTEICRSMYRPMYQPRCRPSQGGHIDPLAADISVDIATDTWPICWSLVVRRISVDCRWYIGQKLRLSVSDV